MRKPFDRDFVLTQGFGENPDSYARFNMKGHNGLDYGLPTGTQVLSPHSGKVIETSFDEFGYGNYLKIENDKEGSVLAHLKEFKVAVGDSVAEGQLVGISNNTGNSTGPHLHWGYYLLPRDRTNGYAGFIDQLPLLTVNDTQAIIDGLRIERDNNWNLVIDERLKNNELSEQLKAEQEKTQGLREANDKLTQADAETGAELLDVSHERDVLKDELEKIKGLLGLTYDKTYQDTEKAIQELRQPIDEQVAPLVKHTLTLQDVLDDFIYKRVPQSKSLITKILDKVLWWIR